METLETLSRFTDKYLQKEGGKLNYVFLGGTAIRLIQEQVNAPGERRVVSDFDLLSFVEKPYPVHSLNPEIIFKLVSLEKGSLMRNVDSTIINGKKYFFMDGAFLTMTKTCAIDTPREKDYNDIKFLYQFKKIDKESLRNLFQKTRTITNNSSIPLETLVWFFEKDLGDANKIRLFQAFPNLVNLTAEFKDISGVRDKLFKYIKRDTSKTGYQISSIIRNFHSLIREVGDVDDSFKKNVLDRAIKLAQNHYYTDMDYAVNRILVPEIRYSSKGRHDVLQILDKNH